MFRFIPVLIINHFSPPQQTYAPRSMSQSIGGPRPPRPINMATAAANNQILQQQAFSGFMMQGAQLGQPGMGQQIILQQQNPAIQVQVGTWIKMLASSNYNTGSILVEADVCFKAHPALCEIFNFPLSK